jgi:enterochelin esterase-like enzyme
MRTCTSLYWTCSTAAFVLLGLLASAAVADDDNKAISSPRLRKLSASIAAGDVGAVEAFWTEVKEQHAPLVEPIDREQGYVWLTYLWRGDGDTRSVLLLGGTSAEHPLDNRMARLPNTDVWYRTVRMRRDLRATYRFLVNPPMIETADGAGKTDEPPKTKTDPLNPRRMISGSLVELTGAPAQPWLQAQDGVPKGKVATQKLHSQILNNDRQIAVYHPAGYDPQGAAYPLVIIFDWDAYTLFVPTPTILDNLIHAGKIPPVVALLVGNAAKQRNTELPCNDTFARFLAEELLPTVRQEHHVSTDPHQVVIGGSSYGGLAASFFALRHPELVGNVLSQSGSYWWHPEHDNSAGDLSAEKEWLTRQYLAAPTQDTRFFIEAGLCEGMLSENRHFRDVLRAKGYQVVAYSEYNGGHDYCCWRGSLADGLIALLGPGK